MPVDLQDGKLMHGENFSLFSAVSALDVRATLLPLSFGVLKLSSFYHALQRENDALQSMNSVSFAEVDKFFN
jgi:hypothetical protein